MRPRSRDDLNDLFAHSRALRSRSYELAAEARRLRTRVGNAHRVARQHLTPTQVDATRDLRKCEHDLDSVLDTLVDEVKRVETERGRVRRAISALDGSSPGPKAGLLRFVARRRGRTK